MNAPLFSSDPLTRFLTQSDHYSREQNRVKERAFLPPADLKLSIFQIKQLDEIEIWKLCQRSTFHGRGDFVVSAVLKVDLKVDPDDDPPRHANIIGWPYEKSAQKLLAIELAAEATLTLRSSDY